MAPLFRSSILYTVFDYDEWPATHKNITKMMGAYNGSMFKLRFQYGAIFRKLWLKDEKEKEKKKDIN